MTAERVSWVSGFSSVLKDTGLTDLELAGVLQARTGSDLVSAAGRRTMAIG